MIPVEERYAPNENNQRTSPFSGDTVQPAVIASLLQESNNYVSSGDTEKAIATLERALRIEPTNALLWHRFALIRLQQSNWQQAISLARKSNALAVDDESLRAENWSIIARAFEALGESEKANEAKKKQRLSS